MTHEFFTLTTTVDLSDSENANAVRAVVHTRVQPIIDSAIFQDSGKSIWKFASDREGAWDVDFGISETLERDFAHLGFTTANTTVSKAVML